MSKANGLKGCRPSQEIIQEQSNTFARLGALTHYVSEAPKEIREVQIRLEELDKELKTAKEQEQAKFKEQLATQSQEAKATTPALDLVTQ